MTHFTKYYTTTGGAHLWILASLKLVRWLQYHNRPMLQSKQTEQLRLGFGIKWNVLDGI